MEKQGWKTLAIIFMSLTAVIIISVAYLMSIGTAVIAAEDECAYNVCEDHPKYYYDVYEKICYCYNSAGDTKITRYMS